MAGTISSFSPSHGIQGQLVVIDGTGFSDVTDVSIGGVAAAFTIYSSTQIGAIVLGLAYSGHVVTVSKAGDWSADSATNFTIDTEPAPPPHLVYEEGQLTAYPPDSWNSDWDSGTGTSNLLLTVGGIGISGYYGDPDRLPDGGGGSVVISRANLRNILEIAYPSGPGTGQYDFTWSFTHGSGISTRIVDGEPLTLPIPPDATIDQSTGDIEAPFAFPASILDSGVYGQLHGADWDEPGTLCAASENAGPLTLGQKFRWAYRYDSQWDDGAGGNEHEYVVGYPARYTGIVSSGTVLSKTDTTFHVGAVDFISDVTVLLQRKTAGGSYDAGISVTDNVATDLTGLTPNTGYVLRFEQTDEYGAVTYSAEFSETTKPSVPAAPTVSGHTPTSLTVTALTFGAELGTLLLQAKPSGGSYDAGSAVTSGAPKTLAGLSSSTDYLLRYEATGDGGDAYSDETPFTTDDPITVPPAAPEIDTKTYSTATLEAIIFGAEFSSVLVQFKATGGSYDDGTAVNSGVAAVLTGLTPSTEYHVRYRANGYSGWANGDELIFTTNPPPVPTAPTEIEDTDLTDTSVRFHMEALPAYATSQGIQIKLRSADSSAYTNAGAALADAGNIDITGLTVNTRYHARPYATGVSGTSHGEAYPFKTELFPPALVPPVAPAAPTLSTRTSTSATIAQPAWPTQQPLATSMKLYRGDPGGGGLLVHTFTASGGAPFADTGLINGESYDYYAVTHNFAGDSPKSPALHVSLTATGLTVSWVKPDAGASVANEIALVVRVQATLPALFDEDSPLQILYNGTPLPGLALIEQTRVDGHLVDGKYRTYFDTSELDYQGEITFYAQAKKSDGFYTAKVPISINIDNTLFNGVTFFEMLLESNKSADIAERNERITKAQINARRDWLERNEAHPGLERYWHAYIKSPAGAALSDDATPEELTTYTKGFQPVLMSYPGYGRSIELTGDQSVANSVSDETLRALFVSYKVETLLKYATPCKSLPKLRERGDNLFGFGITPATVFELGTGDVEIVLDLSARGMTDATDAARLGPDKIFCLNSTTVRICDLTSGDKDGDFKPITETKAPVAVETVGNKVFIVYASGGNSTVWAHDGRDWQIAFSLADTIYLTQAFNGKLYFATAARKLYSYTPGASAPALLYTHIANLTGIYLTSEGVVQFADAEGHIFEVAGALATPIASLGAVRDIAEFQGAALALRGAASGGNVLYLQDADGYSPQYTLTDATAIASLRRLQSVLVAQQGDPLNGGTAAINDESLWGGVTVVEEEKTAYYFRLQRASSAMQSNYRGLNPRKKAILLKPTRYGAKD